jgi:hypothetical protein
LIQDVLERRLIHPATANETRRGNMKKPALAIAVVLGMGGLSSTSFGVQTHYYPFDTNANDASGNGNNGTLNGTATIGTPAYIGAGSLGATNSGAVSIPAFTRPAAFTFASWINVNSISGAEGFLFGQATSGGGNFPIRLNGGSGVFQIGQWDGSTFHAFNQAAGGTGGPGYFTSLMGAGWVQFAAVVQDVGDEKLYINGNLVRFGNISNTMPGSTTFSSIGGLQLGVSSWLYGLNGRMDDVRLYNEALSDSQIAALVPEPASLAVFAVAGAGLLARRRTAR